MCRSIGIILMWQHGAGWLMKIPLEIVFRNMDRSDAIESRIREKADRLERFAENIMRCRVAVEAPHRHHHHGKLYRVSIEIGVPSKRLIVNHTGPIDHAHEDVYVAIRDAFSAATRQLEDYVRTRRGKVKTHEAPPHGRVTRLVPDDGSGLVLMPDGQEIFFNRNSVANGGFDQLEVGSEVRITIAPEESGEAPRAQFVQPVGRTHPDSS